MRIIISSAGSDRTVNFACEELRRYLKLIDRNVFIDRRTYDSFDESIKGVIWVSSDILPASVDDAVLIKVADGAGVIGGSSPRAALIAVYRFLTELGCRFIEPGPDGEIVPKFTLDAQKLNVNVDEKASYRHRAVCIEGAVSYDHVYNMLDWIPKVGMNGYYVQFRVPFTFFDRWYSHTNNPTLPAEPISQDDVTHMYRSFVDEIVKRGLLYHAIGHGWTCEPFGITGSGWEEDKSEISPEIKQYFAEVNGKRELWGGVALNTNLCYSNPYVRGCMTDAITEYCKKNPEVDYLHFWLADGSNNHCECEECSKKRPADFYVMMLNELDEKLTAAGVDIKIVFLIYVDLLWEAETEKLKNQDRFVLMFAPITRTYSKAFSDFDRSTEPELKPFERNKNVMPHSVEENVARLSKWQSDFKGDSFDFDYHLMWDHVRDPGYYKCAEILHNDMVNLDKIGLNGMVSCQLQRVGFPTCLPMYVMAKGLWDKNSKFEDIADEYFTAAFGEYGGAVKEYLKTLSEMFDPRYLRHEITQIDVTAALRFAEIPSYIDKFKAKYISGKKGNMWKVLSVHAEICILLAEALAQKAVGSKECVIDKRDALVEYICKNEPEVNDVLDAWNYVRMVKQILK